MLPQAVPQTRSLGSFCSYKNNHFQKIGAKHTNGSNAIRQRLVSWMVRRASAREIATHTRLEHIRLSIVLFKKPATDRRRAPLALLPEPPALFRSSPARVAVCFNLLARFTLKCHQMNKSAS